MAAEFIVGRQCTRHCSPARPVVARTRADLLSRRVDCSTTNISLEAMSQRARVRTCSGRRDVYRKGNRKEWAQPREKGCARSSLEAPRWLGAQGALAAMFSLVR